MKSILLRDIPESTLTLLKARARRNHRSLQGELHFLLESAVQPRGNLDENFSIRKVRTRGTQNWSREEIYED